jgi:hypothetical protein
MLISRIDRQPARREPLVLAVFSFRHDAHLVPGLLANIAPLVHGHVAWDDRDAETALSSEPMRRNLLLAEARRLGARWILAVDPDERFEDRFAARLPEMLALGEGNLWHFNLCEMFSPRAWRTDGVWGGKSLMRLFPADAAGAELSVPLHAGWVAEGDGFMRRAAGVNLYHLRMATPARRRARRALYAAADPERQFQRIGYDYLDDERGMVLMTIPKGRDFSPAFVEDHGLWAVDPGMVGTPVPDPLEARLAYVAQAASKAGQAAAFHAMQDLCAASPADDDLPHVAASLALTAGLLPEVEALTGAMLAHDGADLHARMLRARARLRAGQSAGAAEDIASLTRALPDCPLVADLSADLARPGADFAAPFAQWRRWVAGAAECREGTGVVSADIAVIVLGFRAQPELAEAVASLLAQDAAAEIVVVNSGGGAPEAVLAAHLDRIRLIAVEEPLRVGAARNIGIDAARAPIIAFLAGDCTAAPGWVSGRLARHRAGAATVSTPVLAMPGAGLVARAANRLKYWVRSPTTPLAEVSHFGRSYPRWLFAEVGAFPPGLQVAEDDALNRLADTVAAPPVWAPEIGTRHRDPERFWQLLADHRARGARRASHPPFRAMAGKADATARLAADMAARLRGGWRAVDADPALSPPARWAMKLVQWLAARADRSGVAAALNRLAISDAALARASGDPAAVLAMLRAAVAGDSESWRKALALGRAEARAGNTTTAETALRRAQALAPGSQEPLAALLALVAAEHGGAAALDAAERAALAVPRSRFHWQLASDAARDAGQPARALAHARRALCLAPDLAAVHQMLASLHGAAADGKMAAFRSLASTRLQASAARHRAR